MTVVSDWKPPTPDSQGRYSVGDWQSVRAAIEAAYAVLGIQQGQSGIDKRDWNLVLLALDFKTHASQPQCVECQQRVPWNQSITCYDCGAPMHKDCATRHFWPNGRPKDGVPEWKR